MSTESTLDTAGTNQEWTLQSSWAIKKFYSASEDFRKRHQSMATNTKFMDVRLRTDQRCWWIQLHLSHNIKQSIKFKTGQKMSKT